MARFIVWDRGRSGYIYEAETKEEAVWKHINGDDCISEVYQELKEYEVEEDEDD